MISIWCCNCLRKKSSLSFSVFRLPEKKICLTGLPRLRPPQKHANYFMHPMYGTNEHAYLSNVPRLPPLALRGAAKKVERREANVNKEPLRKKKRNRLPYFKPPKVELWNTFVYSPGFLFSSHIMGMKNDLRQSRWCRFGACGNQCEHEDFSLC